jgi:hypothetical protein
MFTTEENDAIADTYLNKYIIGRSGMCTYYLSRTFKIVEYIYTFTISV